MMVAVCELYVKFLVLGWLVYQVSSEPACPENKANNTIHVCREESLTSESVYIDTDSSPENYNYSCWCTVRRADYSSRALPVTIVSTPGQGNSERNSLMFNIHARAFHDYLNDSVDSAIYNTKDYILFTRKRSSPGSSMCFTIHSREIRIKLRVVCKAIDPAVERDAITGLTSTTMAHTTTSTTTVTPTQWIVPSTQPTVSPTTDLPLSVRTSKIPASTSTALATSPTTAWPTASYGKADIIAWTVSTVAAVAVAIAITACACQRYHKRKGLATNSAQADAYYLTAVNPPSDTRQEQIPSMPKSATDDTITAVIMEQTSTTLTTHSQPYTYENAPIATVSTSDDTGDYSQVAENLYEQPDVEGQPTNITNTYEPLLHRDQQDADQPYEHMYDGDGNVEYVNQVLIAQDPEDKTNNMALQLPVNDEHLYDTQNSGAAK